jgi:hypothetical protein
MLVDLPRSHHKFASTPLAGDAPERNAEHRSQCGRSDGAGLRVPQGAPLTEDALAKLWASSLGCGGTGRWEVRE